MDAATVNGATPQSRPQFPGVLLMCLLLWFMTRQDSDPFAQSEARDALQSAKHVYGNYSAWINGTQTNYTEESLPSALAPLSQAILPKYPAIDPARSSYWTNVTGFWTGKAAMYNLSSTVDLPSTWAPIARELEKGMNKTEAGERAGTWDWTATEKASFRISDMGVTEDPTIQTITGHFNFENRNEEYLKLQFDGLHFPSTGKIYVLSSPNGMPADIRTLPSMVPSEWRNASIHVIQGQLKEEVDRLQRKVDFLMDIGSDSLPTTETACRFFFYGAIAPSPISVKSMAELEQEMHIPTGISTAARPPIKMDAVLISPQCGIVAEMKEASGLKVDHFWRKVTTYSGLASLLYLGLLALLVRQMEATRTPTGIASVSSWTMVCQAVTDAFASSSHVMFGIMAKNKASLSMIAPGFLACILALMFEVRFTSLIHRIQGPEDALLLNPRPPPPPPAPTSALPASLPSATEVASPTPPVPRLATLRRFLNRLLDLDARGWLFLLLVFMWVFTLSLSLILVAVGILHSLWVPQIVRNVTRGHRKSLSKTYVIGTSVLRSLHLLYVFACPENIMLGEPNWLVYPLICWIAFQVMVLVGQEYLGASFFVPKGWITVPDVYDYHPNLVSDPEAPEQELGDCAICMEPIVVKSDSSVAGFGAGEKTDAVAAGASLLLNAGMRRQYALTPCSHIMHTACLEQWMRVKNICPSCRTPLPPL